ncbi:hypothetical protein FHX81_6858 [Saccharothrix saharensis]|uniref:Uncharacterized protein n=1 Tax=Saccharothrix saharensis TaxID=571190 RepID=A0A543JNS8_9PSEU|nr:hypothetical protein [Saccharothrix saharensis]TQM84414.1 hypothetical protein FHX81_6858 [Saccharothrix saharensis]
MSTPTETKTDFVDEAFEDVDTVEQVRQDGTTTTVVPETEPDRHEHHHHTHEDGELSPLCAGGGCPDGQPAK